jgi:hypothetical protein
MREEWDILQMGNISMVSLFIHPFSEGYRMMYTFKMRD